MYKGFLISMMSLFIFCSEADADLVDKQNGTVTDLGTGLMWQKAETGAMTWAEATIYCKNLRLAGHDDWRLPNCIELQSIVDHSKRYPAIDTTIFPGAKPSNYWSSTTYALHWGIVWVVDFVDGSTGYGLKSSRFYLRAVRGGQ
jgi:hypothetical protein